MTTEDFLEQFPDAEENENCLRDVACPKCGNREKFRIEAKIMAIVEDMGTDRDESDCEWDESSHCACGNDACDKDGPLKDFTIDGLDDAIAARAKACDMF